MLKPNSETGREEREAVCATLSTLINTLGPGPIAGTLRFVADQQCPTVKRVMTVSTPSLTVRSVTQQSSAVSPSPAHRAACYGGMGGCTGVPGREGWVPWWVGRVPPRVVWEAYTPPRIVWEAYIHLLGINQGITSHNPGINQGITSHNPGITMGYTSPIPGITMGYTSPIPGIN